MQLNCFQETNFFIVINITYIPKSSFTPSLLLHVSHSSQNRRSNADNFKSYHVIPQSPLSEITDSTGAPAAFQHRSFPNCSGCVRVDVKSLPFEVFLGRKKVVISQTYTR